MKYVEAQNPFAKQDNRRDRSLRSDETTAQSILTTASPYYELPLL
jgi:hypothetical protein